MMLGSSLTLGWCVCRRKVYSRVPLVIFHLDKSANSIYMHVHVPHMTNMTHDTWSKAYRTRETSNTKLI